jgi:hydrogenase-4 component E
MSDTVFTQLVDLAGGAFLLAAVLALWRRQLAAIVRLFALQGAALAAIVAILGIHANDGQLIALAAGILVLRAWALPALIRRALAAGPAGGEARESAPLVNTSASLLAAAVLAVVAYAIAQPIIRLAPSAATRLLPVALAVVLIGFFALVTRHRAIAQAVGFLLLDNGITLAAFLLTSGVGLVVELGVSLDVLLAAVVLGVLTGRMRATFGGTDLDELRELHD